MPIKNTITETTKIMYHKILQYFGHFLVLILLPLDIIGSLFITYFLHPFRVYIKDPIYLLVLHPIFSIIIWIKANWYLAFCLTLGLSFYLYVLLFRIFRTRRYGPTVPEHVTDLRVGIMFFITITSFIAFLGVIYTMYRLWVPRTHPQSKPMAWILNQASKIGHFYNHVLEITFQTLVDRFFIIVEIIEKGIDPFILFTNHHGRYLGIVIVYNSIPLFISICYLIDILRGTYSYFPRFVILLLIPLAIRIIFFMFKSLTTWSDKYYWQRDFDITFSKDGLEYFGLKDGKNFVNCNNQEEFHKILGEQTTAYKETLTALYLSSAFWSHFNYQLYAKQVLICRLLTTGCFFTGFAYQTYRLYLTYHGVNT